MTTSDIEVFGQNSIRITAGDKKIYIDPFEMKVEPKDADFILITHDHYDHFSTEDIEKVACNDTVMVVPEKMKIKAQAAANLVREIVTVEQRSYRELYGLEFDTIPVHYGSIVGKPSDGEAFAGLVEPPVKVELKIQF